VKIPRELVCIDTNCQRRARIQAVALHDRLKITLLGIGIGVIHGQHRTIAIRDREPFACPFPATACAYAVGPNLLSAEGLNSGNARDASRHVIERRAAEKEELRMATPKATELLPITMTSHPDWDELKTLNADLIETLENRFHLLAGVADIQNRTSRHTV
jgi:hypothetical protein